MNIIELMEIAKDSDKVKCKLPNGESDQFKVEKKEFGGWELIDREGYLADSGHHLHHLVRADYEIIKPKYYLKHKWAVGYLNKCFNGKYYVSGKGDGATDQTKFTLEEIEEIKKKFNTNLEDFEMIEVEE